MGDDLVDGIDAGLMANEVEDVSLVRMRDTGHTGFLPNAARKYPAAVQARLVEVQRAAMEIMRLRDFVDAEAPELRDMGVSWNVLGFCAMVDATSAQRRWGTP